MAAVRSDHEALAERRKSGPGLWSSRSEDHYVKEGSVAGVSQWQRGPTIPSGRVFQGCVNEGCAVFVVTTRRWAALWHPKGEQSPVLRSSQTQLARGSWKLEPRGTSPMTLEKLLPTEGAHLGTRKKARDCQMSEYTSPYLSHTEPLDPLFTGIRSWLQTPSWRMRSITEPRFSGKWAWKNRKLRRLGYSSAFQNTPYARVFPLGLTESWEGQRIPIRDDRRRMSHVCCPDDTKSGRKARVSLATRLPAWSGLKDGTALAVHVSHMVGVLVVLATETKEEADEESEARWQERGPMRERRRVAGRWPSWYGFRAAKSPGSASTSEGVEEDVGQSLGSGWWLCL
ncbi:hypothetical protein FA13DRAFT_1718402 [Coprinellus micaceus]|uniref:Uncharacterized protein n=1 Tax=Coprinellus micaceus TaxID=71717 RepID=A0A4Y7SFJ8_COPMI|nr:hypothetical protein FA13DRAFT_1718402 [Coprinellus micaceus]